MTPEEPKTTTVPWAEVRGQVKNYKVEIVIRNADGTVKEKRVETVSKAV
jgi:hypothetical protein